MPLDGSFNAPATRSQTLGPGPGLAAVEFVHALSREIVRVEAPPGATVAEMLRAGRIDPARYGDGLAWIEDAARTRDPVPLDAARLDRIRPKAGTITTVMLWPRGGGGGGGGKTIMRVVLALAVVALAAFGGPLIAGAVAPILGITSAAGVAALGAVFSGVISVIGNMLVNALIPPPKPRSEAERQAAIAEDRTGYTIQGTSNRARPYAPIPLHLGRLRRWPDLQAEFVTDIRGNDQYLRFLMVVGVGPLKMEEWKVGETPLAEFQGVTVNVREGWPGDPPPSIYTDDFHTEGLQIALTAAAGWQERVTVVDTDEIQVELAFPQGLLAYGTGTSSGQIYAASVSFEAQIAPFGSESWTNPTWVNAAEPGFATPGVIVVTDSTRSGQPRRVGRIKPGRGQWRVRVRRTTADQAETSNVVDQSFWAGLKSVKHTAVLPLLGKVAWIEGEIKASGQLNGVLQELNCVATSYAEVYDPGAGTWSWQVTRNPADLFIHVATHATLPRKLARARLDLDSLMAWRADAAQLWTTGKPRWRFDRVYDSPSTLAAILDEIAAVGRARRGMIAGKHGVIRDVPQAAIAQHFTPRNSWGFKVDIPFRRRLHGVRVRYNKDGLGQEAEIVVYDDGYSAANATEFETGEAIGVTDADQVWCLWRYHLAVQRLRPHSYGFAASAEHLVAPRGAVARASHDVPGWGLGYGRLKSVMTNGGGAFTGVTLDAEVTMESGQSYGIRLRNPAGSFYAGVTTGPGTTSTLTFAVPQPAAWDLRPGDLFGFGPANRESVELIVAGIAGAPDLAARLTCYDAAPGVHSADTGPIPAFDPQITVPPLDRRLPDAPTVRAIVSDESVLVKRAGGGLVPRILVQLAPFGGAVMPDAVEGRFKPAAGGTWSPVPLAPVAALELAIEDVIQGVAYEVQLRGVTNDGRASPWHALPPHTVIGKTTRPPNVAALFEAGTHLVWPYPDPPIDVLYGGGFAVRYHYGVNAEWATAIRAHDALLAESSLALTLLPPGALTVMVKAVDVDGNESAAAATLAVVVDDPAAANIVQSVDYEALNFPGTIAGGAVVSGDLVATGQALFHGPDAALFWSADGDVFWADDYAQLVYQFSFVPEAAALPARLTLVHALAGLPRRIEYAADSEDLFWSADGDLFWGPDAAPFWGAVWRDWPGALDLTDRRQVDFRIAAGGGASQGRVDALALRLDVPDIVEEFANVVLTAGGTRLALTKTYRAIRTVIPALLNDGGAARTVRVMDKSASLGPLLQAFDATFAATGAVVDARVKGY